MTSRNDILAAHRHSYRNMEEIRKSTMVGCFYCLRIYPAAEVTTTTDKGATALCAYCPMDAVIGDASGYPITHDFLCDMGNYWFDDQAVEEEVVGRRT